MPTYDLICSGCKYEEELFTMHIVTEVENKCPTCDIVLTKKIGRVATIFKGSGFYATEYGKSKANAYKEDKKEIEEREKFIEQARKDVGE